MRMDHILDGSSDGISGAIYIDFEDFISVLSPAMIRRLLTGSAEYVTAMSLRCYRRWVEFPEYGIHMNNGESVFSRVLIESGLWNSV